MAEEWIKLSLEGSKELEELVFNTNDWKSVKDSDGIKIFKRPSKHMEDRSAWRTELTLNVPAQMALEIAYPTTDIGLKSKWDTQAESCKMVQEVRHDMLIVHNKMKAQLIGLVSARDNIEVVRINNNDKFKSIELRSIEHPEHPPSDGYVRTWDYPTGVFFIPNSEDANKTNVVAIFQSDMKVQAVPIPALEAAIPTMLTNYFESFQKIQDLKDEYKPLGDLPGMKKAP